MGEIANLNQIVSEIKFFENQAVVSYWEIGKRLSQAKSQVGHGNWENWVGNNLGYSTRTAGRLIQVYNDYPNPTALSDLNMTQALALTTIKDEEDRQNFIDSHEVEDMTTRQLQAEIKEYKESLKAKEEELNEVNSCYKSLSIVAKNREEENDRLREDLRKEKEKPAEVIEKEVIKEVIPEDYEDLKGELKDLLDYQRELENKLYELQKKPKEEVKEVIKEVERGDIKYYKSEIKRLEEKLQKEITKNLGLISDKKLAISQLESEKAHQKIVDDISGFHYNIAGFIQANGGLLYLTEYLDEIPAKNRNLFLDSIKHLREFSEQLYLNVEERIKNI